MYSITRQYNASYCKRIDRYESADIRNLSEKQLRATESERPTDVGATMQLGVKDSAIDPKLASALRPLVHPPSSVAITRELASKVYWDFAIAWAGIQTPAFRRYLAHARLLQGEEGRIAFHRGVFLSLDTIIGNPLQSKEVDQRTGQPKTMINHLLHRAKSFPDLVKG